MRYHTLILQVALLSGCAAVNPNPNTGQRSVDFVMSEGGCDKAVELAQPAAERGEPWAQYRMGMLGLDKRCTKKPEAIPWLSKAATFQAESAWERGSEVALGPNGYFNARASATNAAIALGNLFATYGHPAMNWYWLRRATSQFSPAEKEADGLREVVQELEKSVPPEDQRRISEHWDKELPWHK